MMFFFFVFSVDDGLRWAEACCADVKSFWSWWMTLGGCAIASSRSSTSYTRSWQRFISIHVYFSSFQMFHPSFYYYFFYSYFFLECIRKRKWKRFGTHEASHFMGDHPEKHTHTHKKNRMNPPTTFNLNQIAISW